MNLRKLWDEVGAMIEEPAETNGARGKNRRSIATADLSDERVRAIGTSRMDERHAHLDAFPEQE
jgi:hypothetical protein